MTAVTDIDRVLDDWFASEAPASAPAELMSAIADATATTRRRPGWLVPDRWLARTRSSPVDVRVLVLAVVAALVVVAGLVAIGSRPRVPAPFGPARAGMILLSLGGDLVALNPDGSGHLTLTADDAWDSNPVFSRDGTMVAYWSRPADSLLSDLVVLNLQTQRRHRIAEAMFVDSQGSFVEPAVSWSPDGESVAYSTDPGDGSRIFVAQTDGSGVAPIGDPALGAAYPSWSPDGTLIAFRGGTGDALGVYVMRPDGTDARRLTTTRGTADSFYSAWSPDGSRLAFNAGDGVSAVWTVGVDGTGERVVDQGDENQDDFVGGAAWSPDGRRLAWLHAHADPAVPGEYLVANADGSDPKRFPWADVPRHTLSYDYLAPAVNWSPDGRHVIGILASPDGLSVDRLLLIDPDSGLQTVIDTPALRSWDQQRLAP